MAPSAPGGAGVTVAWRNRWEDGVLYGSLGLPLAFVALPLYVVLPDHYAREFGVPLPALASVLLGARLLDAVIDPLIGRWVDQLLDRSPHAAKRVALFASVCLAAGFAALFFPPEGAADHMARLLAWCTAALVLTYTAFSVVTVIHQAWGARLGGDEAQRVRIVAWREGLALVGVLLASLLPSVAGLLALVLCFSGLLALAWLALAHGPEPLSGPAPTQTPLWTSLQRPWHNPAFLRLLPVFLLNGIAMAIPASLVLFFIQDRLQAPGYTPLFLSSYFAAAALSTPVWSRCVTRWGLLRCWVMGMGLSVVAFSGTALLGAGDVIGYTLVCVASGIALGADLALPGALLAGVIQQAGHRQAEGAYFGWWNLATKLNLALAAGIALPLLHTFGYATGQRDPAALQALSIAYCAVPCLLKLAAAGLLYVWWIRPQQSLTLSKSRP